jgi:hypothetical protein
VRGLRRRPADLLGHIEESVQDAPVVVGEFVEDRIRHRQAPFPAAGVPFTLILAAQQSARERAPGAKADAELLRGGLSTPGLGRDGAAGEASTMAGAGTSRRSGEPAKGLEEMFTVNRLQGAQACNLYYDVQVGGRRRERSLFISDDGQKLIWYVRS